MSSTEWAAWGAVLIALLSIFASLAGVYWQIKKQWLLHSATMVTTLLEKFESEQFELKRQRCAELAARHLSGEQASLVNHYGFGVLGFFEHVGHLVRRGAVDEEMVWNRLGWEIVGYYEALTSRIDLIAVLREEDHPSAYAEFEWLYQKMVGQFRRHGSRVYDSEQKLIWMEKFLNQECLGGPGAQARTEVANKYVVNAQPAPPADG